MTVSIGLGRVGSHKIDPWTTLVYRHRVEFYFANVTSLLQQFAREIEATAAGGAGAALARSRVRGSDDVTPTS